MSIERRPGQKPRARAPRNDHPFRPAVAPDPDEVAADDSPTAAPDPHPEPVAVTPPPPPAPAPSAYDPQVSIGGRGPESVRLRLKVWCAQNREPMDKALVRAITEFLDRNNG